MTSRLTRLISFCVIAIAVATTVHAQASAKPVASVKAQCESDRAQDFVTYMQAGGVPMPTTLAEISGYTMPYRRAFLRTMAPAAVAKLWQEQLRQAAATDEDLSPNQRKLLMTLANRLPTFMADSTGREQLLAMEPALIDMFGKEKSRTLFIQIGSDDPNTRQRRLVQGRMTTAARFIPATLVRRMSDAGAFGRFQNDCNCAASDCASGGTCQNTGCVQYSWGCGFWGWGSCIGECQKFEF